MYMKREYGQVKQKYVLTNGKIEYKIKYIVTVQNPFGFAASCCAKQRIEKFFSALICCYFVDKNDDFLFVYQPCG